MSKQAVLMVQSESEARMYREVLEKSGIPAEIKRSMHNEALSARFAGAAMPNDIWVIGVEESNIEKAKELLPEQSEIKHITTPARTSARIVAGIVLIFLIGGAIVALFGITYYLMSLRK